MWSPVSMTEAGVVVEEAWTGERAVSGTEVLWAVS